jgi:DNA-binding transcriptional LysR family regulator
VNHLDLRRLRYFAMLARERHFTRAAERLGIVQSALSQQIRILERELGAELVDRDGNGFQLTEVGLLVAGEAEELLARAAATGDRITAAVRGQSGRIRLAYTRSARGGRVDELIERFRHEHPNVELVTETGWTALNVAGLLAGRLDIAFVRPPLEEEDLSCRFVDTEELLLALPAKHPLVRHRRVAREALVGLPVVMWPRENGAGMFDRTVGQIWPNGGFRHVRVEPDDEQLLRAVAGGEVIAVVPEGRARALPLPEVRLRHFTGPRPTVDVALAYRSVTVAPVVLRLLALLDDPPPGPAGQGPGAEAGAMPGKRP